MNTFLGAFSFHSHFVLVLEIIMEKHDSDTSLSWNDNSSHIRSETESEADYAVVTLHAIAYFDKLLARAGQEVDSDGIIV